MSRTPILRHLLTTTIACGSFAGLTPAFAQDATNQPGTQRPGTEQSTSTGPEAGTPAPFREKI
ncbi:MAG TPA: hypothetical protein VGC56_17895 [Allosphingosinicella sp.]